MDPPARLGLLVAGDPRRPGVLRAVLFTALTVALHFESGYLALTVLIIWPVVAGRPCRARIRRAAFILIGSLLATAWVIIPLLQ